MADGTDPLTGLSVKSLYGNHLKPEETDLADVDAVLVDLPDVGCRCYTYLWTLSHVMESCNRFAKRLIVLDRPNPASGVMTLAEGPGLNEAACSSFIGRWNIPLRHSCTYGELARLWKMERMPSLDLQVVEMAGWKRSMFYHDGVNSFIPTSPAIANAEACLLYTGLCLLEATNLSEGRGTPMSFRIAGAPWMDAFAATAHFNSLELPGVVARAITFVPESGQYKQQSCCGVMLHVTEPHLVHTVWASIALIKLIKDGQPEHFTWSPYPTHVNPTGKAHLDKLFGVENAEALFERPWDEFAVIMRQYLESREWEHRVQSHLLYV
jgi:uncharacterized protein YbbC (DUF1343 family)